MSRSWRVRKAVIALLVLPGCTELGDPVARAAPDAIAMLDRFSYTAPDGAHIAALRAGEGRRVIYVHGTPGEKEGWADYLIDPPFPAEAIAIDRPGFGDSGPDQAVTSLRAQAEALTPLIDDADVAQGRPILVGHSLGGPIVAEAALMRPEAIGAVVLIAGSFDPRLEDVHVLQPLGETWPIRALLPRAIRNANRELLALEPQLRDLAPRLSGITAPIVVLQGGRDGLVPAANADYLKPRFEDRGDVVWRLPDDADHFVIWNAKSLVDAALRDAVALAE